MDLPLDSTKDFETRNRPVILLAATLWWQLSARLAIRLLEYGCRVSAVCPKGHPLRSVRGVHSLFTYHRLSSLSSLEKAIRQAAPDIIIPCDDRAVWQLHELHRLKPELRALIAKSLGSPGGFARVERRDLLLADAEELGIRIPDTKRITCEEDIRDWFATVAQAAVLKLDGTWGGAGVILAQSEQQAIAAYQKLSQPPGFATGLKRFLVNRDPIHISKFSNDDEPSVMLQQLVEGCPANSMAVCWEGKILSIVSVEVLASQGATGAAFLVRTIENDEMVRAAVLLAEKLHLSGFFGLDFQFDRSTGQPYLIEMNPRCTQLGHLHLSSGTSLAGALCEKLSGAACKSNDASVEGRVVAFFPQAAQWKSKNSFPGDVYDDIPIGEPALVRELSRPSWPERQWIARIYHWFRPVRAVEPVAFWPESEEGRYIPSAPVKMESTYR